MLCGWHRVAFSGLRDISSSQVNGVGEYNINLPVKRWPKTVYYHCGLTLSQAD